MFITPRRLLPIIGLALLTASPSRGEVGLLVLEPGRQLARRLGVGPWFIAITPISCISKDKNSSRRRRCLTTEHRWSRTGPRPRSHGKTLKIFGVTRPRSIGYW